MYEESAGGTRRTILRSMLFFIILGTLPFYLLGFIVLGSGGSSNAETALTEEPTVTLTPLGADITETPTNTPTPTRDATSTQISPLQPTPLQFVPPTRIPPTATPIPIIIPTDTPAPTLTPNVDSDGDGLLDHNDNCPTDPGPPGNSGCPLPDRDGDGILDNNDQCPDEPGPRSNNGCPEPADRDGDRARHRGCGTRHRASGPRPWQPP